MEIKVLGPGCAKCKKVEKTVRDVVEAVGVTATVDKVTDMMEIAKHGVVTTPAVVIDGVVKSAGRVPKAGEIKAWLEEK